MNKLFLVIATAIGITAAANTALAAPLPASTKLTIVKSTEGSTIGSVGCTNGSCFGMFLFAGVYAWTPLGPGTDGGIIVGKAQRCSSDPWVGQELIGPAGFVCEMTEVWNYGDSWGGFGTYPGGELNLYDDASCSGMACLGKTELKYLYTYWGGQIIPLGSANGCNPAMTPACTPDQIAGIFVDSWTLGPSGTVPRKYELLFSQVIPTVFPNYPFKLVLRGAVGQQNQPPVVVVSPSYFIVHNDSSLTFSIYVTDYDGPQTPTCRVVGPTMGKVVLNGCTSGTYTAYISPTGVYNDIFSIIANDGLNDGSSSPVIVTVVMGDPTPTAGNVNITGDYGVPLSWTPVVTNATSCYLGTPPSNGIASVASDCSTGSYTANIGFVGTDSFTYIARGSGYLLSLPATVTAAITAPTTDNDCIAQYPVTQATITGKQGHLTITVTGNLISVNPNGKEIKICPTTTARYNASTTTPGATVVCQVKSNTSRGQGHLKVNDHIKCTDKPVGNDKIHVKIKSGVYRKAM